MTGARVVVHAPVPEDLASALVQLELPTEVDLELPAVPPASEVSA
jgi:hypothetical protein